MPVGVSRQEYVQAAQTFRETYRREPNRIEVLSLLAELAVVDEKLELAAACFEFLPTRARLDLAGWEDVDIFAHS